MELCTGPWPGRYSEEACTGMQYEVCLATSPWLLPKRVVQRVQSEVSSFNFQSSIFLKVIQ